MCKNRFSSSASFLGIIAFSVLVTIIVFCYKSHIYKEKMQTIIEMQKEDNDQLKQLISSVKIKSANNKDFQTELVSCLDAHNSKMQHELEMINADIESGIDMLTLWASIITIVFLVFSIYSIFRTDEMLSKAQEVMDDIKIKGAQAQSICDGVENKSNTIMQGISQQVSAIDNQAKQLSIKLAAIQRQFDSIGDSETQGQGSQNEEDEAAGAEPEPTGNVPKPPTNPEHPEA